MLATLPRCRACLKEAVTPILHCGEVPVSSRFLDSPTAPEITRDQVLGFCERCGTTQWREGWRRSDFPPAAYREPEGHLDELADTISRLPGLGRQSTVRGLSPKDDSLVERLRERGVGTDGEGREPSDIVVARHVIEHEENIADFLSRVKRALAPRGYLVLETPHAGDIFTSGDFSQLWEEHFVFFTPATLQRTLGRESLSPLYSKCFPAAGAGETPLAVIAQVSERLPPPLPVSAVERSAALGLPARVEELRERWAAYLGGETARGKKIALFGAGHLSVTFALLGDVAGHVRAVFDDNPAKIGKFLPGARLPILESARLAFEDIDICLLGISTESETGISRRLRQALRWEGEAYSINPRSPRAPELIRSGRGPADFPISRDAAPPPLLWA